ncbi:hypothetical protein ACEPAH_6529 [Sanghuangporus vaninii]
MQNVPLRFVEVVIEEPSKLKAKWKSAKAQRGQLPSRNRNPAHSELVDRRPIPPRRTLSKRNPDRSNGADDPRNGLTNGKERRGFPGIRASEFRQEFDPDAIETGLQAPALEKNKVFLSKRPHHHRIRPERSTYWMSRMPGDLWTTLISLSTMMMFLYRSARSPIFRSRNHALVELRPENAVLIKTLEEKGENRGTIDEAVVEEYKEEWEKQAEIFRELYRKAWSFAEVRRSRVDS